MSLQNSRKLIFRGRLLARRTKYAYTGPKEKYGLYNIAQCFLSLSASGAAHQSVSQSVSEVPAGSKGGEVCDGGVGGGVTLLLLTGAAGGGGKIMSALL